MRPVACNLALSRDRGEIDWSWLLGEDAWSLVLSQLIQGQPECNDIMVRGLLKHTIFSSTKINPNLSNKQTSVVAVMKIIVYDILDIKIFENLPVNVFLSDGGWEVVYE
jgi:hypothetical protein